MECQGKGCEQSCTLGGCGMECNAQSCNQRCTRGDCKLACGAVALTCSQSCAVNKETCQKGRS